ncbi:hypothetical protein HAX54_025992 [Datura stramonium]|uniref:Uncharacterized protein n=1 Tax=Datura stramonium TaxID=4076 RepID=A0ABS8S6K4_DATST|nr:hypothetical protein [Datura stramonium]
MYFHREKIRKEKEGNRAVSPRFRLEKWEKGERKRIHRFFAVSQLLRREGVEGKRETGRWSPRSGTGREGEKRIWLHGEGEGEKDGESLVIFPAGSERNDGWLFMVARLSLGRNREGLKPRVWARHMPKEWRRGRKVTTWRLEKGGSRGRPTMIFDGQNKVLGF